jgi:putative ABC transport system permease protein
MLCQNVFWPLLPEDRSAGKSVSGGFRLQVACSEFWSEFISAFRNIVRQYRRSLFGISAVAFGVIALLLAAGFVEWIFWASREGTIQEGLGHIHVMRPGYLEDGQADPNRFLMPDNSAQLSAIEALPAVRTVAPRVALPA